MALKPPVDRFRALFLLALLLLFCIYLGSESHNAAVSHVKRTVSEPWDILSQRTSVDERDLHVLSKRAPPKSAAEAAAKAEGYLCQLKDSEGGPQSQYTDVSDLNAAWSQEPYGSSGKTDTSSQIETALSALDLPTELGQRGLKGLLYFQDQDYKVDGKDYDATWGYYKASMSASAGYISAEDNESPAYAAKGQPSPGLSKLSDVYFLMWKSIAGSQVRNIKYFFRFHVINGPSKSIAYEVAGGSIPEWPGVSFDMSTDKGKAILGTPNGAGVAFFLMDHREDLGARLPKKVTLFKTVGQDANGNPEDWIHFLFYINV